MGLYNVILGGPKKKKLKLRSHAKTRFLSSTFTIQRREERGGGGGLPQPNPSAPPTSSNRYCRRFLGTPP